MSGAGKTVKLYELAADDYNRVRSICIVPRQSNRNPDHVANPPSQMLTQALMMCLPESIDTAMPSFYVYLCRDSLLTAGG